MRMTVELTDNEVRLLGYNSRTMRNEPKKSWTAKELKEHARITIERIINEGLEDLKRRNPDWAGWKPKSKGV